MRGHRQRNHSERSQMVRSLKLVQYLSQGKLEMRRFIFNKMLSSDTNSYPVDHVRRILCKPRGRTRRTEKSIIMRCKENLTFCDDYGGNNISPLLNHHMAPSFTWPTSLHNHNCEVGIIKTTVYRGGDQGLDELNNMLRASLST